MPTDILERRAHLRHLANEVFPAAARSGAYPIHLNHCFLRVVYDAVFEARWDTVLPKGRKPVVDRLAPKQLARAIEVGEGIIADPQLCKALNAKSLSYRRLEQH